jgi:hypothetical protein
MLDIDILDDEEQARTTGLQAHATDHRTHATDLLKREAEKHDQG